MPWRYSYYLTTGVQLNKPRFLNQQINISDEQKQGYRSAPIGIGSKGFRTRSKKKSSSKFIIERRKK